MENGKWMRGQRYKGTSSQRIGTLSNLIQEMLTGRHLYGVNWAMASSTLTTVPISASEPMSQRVCTII